MMTISIFLAYKFNDIWFKTSLDPCDLVWRSLTRVYKSSIEGSTWRWLHNIFMTMVRPYLVGLVPNVGRGLPFEEMPSQSRCHHLWSTWERKMSELWSNMRRWCRVSRNTFLRWRDNSELLPKVPRIAYNLYPSACRSEGEYRVIITY